MPHDFSDAAWVEKLVLRILEERKFASDERFRAQEQAIRKAEHTLAETLRGFPQEYAKLVITDQLRNELAAMQRDHVRRVEFESISRTVSRLQGALVFVSALLPIATAVIVHYLK